MRVAAALSLSVLAAPATAQTRAEIDRRLSPAYTACMAGGDAAQGVTSAMMSCLGSEIDVQDARLNQAYRMVMQRLRPAAKARLRTSERRWIAGRDAGCRARSDRDGGGTASALGYNSCTLDETVRRTMWLERYRG